MQIITLLTTTSLPVTLGQPFTHHFISSSQFPVERATILIPIHTP